MTSHYRVLSKPELRQSKLSRTEFPAIARAPITVVLDGVSGNYNIGAIFRLCDAFLIERLVICGVPV
jgi:tRNA G18 (ribose-2'-O)-methylase SpoU